MPKAAAKPADIVQTGSVFRTGDAGELIECKSFLNNDTGECWTEESAVQPPAPEGE